MARARSGFECLGVIDRAYAQVRAQVTQETAICEELLARLRARGRAPQGGHSTAESRYDLAFGLLTMWSVAEVDGVLVHSDGSRPTPRASTTAAMTLDVYSGLFDDDLDGLAAWLDEAHVYSMCTNTDTEPVGTAATETQIRSTAIESA